MITNTNKRVICIKDIPSNMIEEAIFILKTDIEKTKNPQRLELKKNIIVQETKDFLKEYSSDFERIMKQNELQFRQKKKIKMISGILGFCFICLIISIIIFS